MQRIPAKKLKDAILSMVKNFPIVQMVIVVRLKLLMSLLRSLKSQKEERKKKEKVKWKLKKKRLN